MAGLVIDCTYKTNRFYMPLLNAIIVTGFCRLHTFGCLARLNQILSGPSCRSRP
ncbi:hypothetical protein F441_11682 [Phytophthora nicotianae CJ01A1]|uniref:Uncharacterized protein n=6 Tax=Phytophthora nicotianae TaxID=4792 RepID=W2Q272_PHYN3|nr:hypothetical protein PPTG_23293 [Phytophthora nicotianae INRA-310]ETI43320.1 hypothetical protein F443_11748 [Phytophthora nicotianae P1569]ETK83318.1 hypothetical protein L915_11438 [Phytophthora nicotianae]ETO71971.1 hypothetical protein F444_11832 [Phytophthora nicotianae P1976]ETP13043.1 hypothetical protein F441_11682 [Phytophthora nicotianae CJ01A1]ETP41122.1 hypothetical protein F442_11651 [Phytophthora nicotianae P10297]